MSSIPPGQTALYNQGKLAYNRLFSAERTLGSKIGATEVALLGYPEASGHRARTIVAWPDEDLAQIDPYDDAVHAFRRNAASYTLGSIGGVQYARARRSRSRRRQ